MRSLSGMVNRDTPEYFGFSQVFTLYKQTFTGIKLINGKFIKHVGHSIMNGRTL